MNCNTHYCNRRFFYKIRYKASHVAPLNKDDKAIEINNKET